MPKVHYATIGSLMPSDPYAPAERGAAAAVRGAVRALFARLGVKLGGAEPARRRPTAADVCLRDRAHLAFDTVEAGGHRALDAALDVFAAELDATRARVANQAEALKAVRLYAQEPWVRSLAGQTLAAPDRAPTLPCFPVAADADDQPAEQGRLDG